MYARIHITTSIYLYLCVCACITYKSLYKRVWFVFMFRYTAAAVIAATTPFHRHAFPKLATRSSESIAVCVGLRQQLSSDFSIRYSY